MNNTATAPVPTQPGTAWSPFRYRAFTVLWLATVVSNIGGWMYAAAAGWQMTLLDPSPLMVSLVQAASTLPVFIFALPAGALADIIDRRKLLISVQTLLMLTVLLFAILTMLNQITPVSLLLFTFLIGIGTALIAPAWQAIVPELVTKKDLQPAIALNSVGINISRAIGPALAGIFITAFGIASPYFVDAFSFLGVIIALMWWRNKRPARELPAEHFLGAMRAGLRYARKSPPLRATLVRALGFFVFGSAYWALLPLIAKDLLHGGAELYGTLLASIGIGAVVGALFLPTMRKTIGSDHLLSTGTVATALSMITLGLANSAIVASAVCLLAGAAWIAALSSLNVSAQVALPSWVKARGLSIYLVVFFGAMTAGSMIWGQAASMLGIANALLLAAFGSLFALLAGLRWKLTDGDALDLAPSMHWPVPVLASEVAHDRGPVLVTVEYQVELAHLKDFLTQLNRLAEERRRDGAFSWGVFEDTAEPERYLEYFMVESWLEHLRQHQRITVADRDIQTRITYLLKPNTSPRVSHFLAPDPHAQTQQETPA